MQYGGSKRKEVHRKMKDSAGPWGLGHRSNSHKRGTELAENQLKLNLSMGEENARKSMRK